jgi:molybdopterin converting factor small subunit
MELLAILLEIQNAMDSIKSSFPEFNRLTSLMIAINDEYASDSDQINDGDTLVLIPPVSGG